MVDENEHAPTSLGALVGWTRHNSPNGAILCLETATSLAAAKGGDVVKTMMALNVRQLRSLALDLNRAADEAEKRTVRPPPRSFWQRWT